MAVGTIVVVGLAALAIGASVLDTTQQRRAFGNDRAQIPRDTEATVNYGRVRATTTGVGVFLSVQRFDQLSTPVGLEIDRALELSSVESRIKASRRISWLQLTAPTLLALADLLERAALDAEAGRQGPIGKTRHYGNWFAGQTMTVRSTRKAETPIRLSIARRALVPSWQFRRLMLSAGDARSLARYLRGAHRDLVSGTGLIQDTVIPD